MTTNILDFSTQFSTKSIFLIVLSVVILASLNSVAQNSNIKAKTDTVEYKWERISFSFGGFAAGLNNDIRFDSEELGLGMVVDLEDALGLNSTSRVLRGGAEFNYGRKLKHTVLIDYFGVFRNATKTLDSELIIGESVFPVGTELDSKYNMQIFKGAYSYSFFKDERVNLGLSFGLYVMPIKFSTSALGLSNETAEFIAPLPVVGFRTAFVITPKLIIKNSNQILYLKMGNYSGSITDVNVRLDYNVFKHIGLGMGLDTFQLKLSAIEESNSLGDFKGTLRTGYVGFLLYGKIYL